MVELELWTSELCLRKLFGDKFELVEEEVPAECPMMEMVVLH